MNILMEDSFSRWMRYNLKDAYSGLITQDIDFVVIKKSKIGNVFKFYFIEEKNSMNARVGPAQIVIFKMFDDLFGTKSFEIDGSWYSFLGTYILHVLNIKTLKDCENFNRWLNEKISNRQKHEISPEILYKLWDCKGYPKKQKTERERSGYRGSLLKDWFDKCYTSDTFFIQKIDWVFVNYCTGYFIFLEELTNGKSLTNKRKVFIETIDRIFHKASKENKLICKAKNPKSGALYEYLGYYILSFSGTNPENSERIILNNIPVEKNKLINILNLDNNEILHFAQPKQKGEL